MAPGNDWESCLFYTREIVLERNCSSQAASCTRGLELGKDCKDVLRPVGDRRYCSHWSARSCPRLKIYPNASTDRCLPQQVLMTAGPQGLNAHELVDTANALGLSRKDNVPWDKSMRRNAATAVRNSKHLVNIGSSRYAHLAFPGGHLNSDTRHVEPLIGMSRHCRKLLQGCNACSRCKPHYLVICHGIRMDQRICQQVRPGHVWLVKVLMVSEDDLGLIGFCVGVKEKAAVEQEARKRAKTDSFAAKAPGLSRGVSIDFEDAAGS